MQCYWLRKDIGGDYVVTWGNCGDVALSHGTPKLEGSEGSEELQNICQWRSGGIRFTVIRKTAILELVHTDVCNTIRVKSVEKDKYFVKYLDDYSRWCTVRFLKSKSKVAQVTKMSSHYSKVHKITACHQTTERNIWAKILTNFWRKRTLLYHTYQNKIV